MKQETEIWKPIKDYEGIYEVSNLGNIKSFKRSKEKVLKGCIGNLGYRRYSLRKDNHKKKK